MENARQFPLIEFLSNDELLRIHGEAVVGYNDYEAALLLTSKELGRRALFIGDVMSYYDASVDLDSTPNPPDAPQLWTTNQDWG